MKTLPLKSFLIVLVGLIVVAWTVKVSSAETLFEDNFDDGNYDGWEVVNGTWEVITGELRGYGPGPTDGWIYAGDNSWTNYVYEAKVLFESGNAELVFRSTGFWENEYRFEIWHSHPQYANKFNFWKYQDGVIIQFTDGSIPSPVPITNPIDVKIEAVGNVIRFFLNGQQIYEVVDPDPLLNGRIGLGSIWDWSCRFDNVKVFSISEPQVPGGQNIIQNGDFSNILSHWQFEDVSQIHNCPVPPYAEAYVESGRAVIHCHSCASEGLLHQYLSNARNPDYFAFDYQLNGNCSQVNAFLYDGSERILDFVTASDSAAPSNSGTQLILFGEIWWIPQTIFSGRVEILFDWDTMEAMFYLNAIPRNTFVLPIDLDLSQITLRSAHGCYDGRNDTYGYFDNVILIGNYQDSIKEVLQETANTINNILDDNVFKNPNNKNALTNKIKAALMMIDEGLYEEAVDKLENDILGKTDGCAETGFPDNNDWITDCESQNEVYPMIMEAIALLENLI